MPGLGLAGPNRKKLHFLCGQLDLHRWAQTEKMTEARKFLTLVAPPRVERLRSGSGKRGEEPKLRKTKSLAFPCTPIIIIVFTSTRSCQCGAWYDDLFTLRNKHQHEDCRKDPGLRPTHHCQNLDDIDASRRTFHAGTRQTLRSTQLSQSTSTSCCLSPSFVVLPSTQSAVHRTFWPLLGRIRSAMTTSEVDATSEFLRACSMQPELQLFGLHGAGQAQTLKAKCARFRFRVWGLSPTPQPKKAPPLFSPSESCVSQVKR